MVKVCIRGSSGRMGHFIADIAGHREDCKIIAGVDINPVKYGDFPVYTELSQMPEKPDVVIDFTRPDELDEMLGYCLTNGAGLVAATTGYSPEQVAKIKSAGSQIPVFFTANMSMGINLLSELVKKAAAFLGDGFDVEIVERHHNQKVDAPSGTALMLADSVNEARGHKYGYTYDRHSVRRKRDPSEIGIHSVRGGTIVGDHEVIFAGRDEVITLSHSAFSKEVFAVGAVNAAVFIADKGPGLYSMKDLLEGSDRGQN